SPIRPIRPSGTVEGDIRRVMTAISGHSVLTMRGTCLDPSLYDLESSGAILRFHTANENLNEIAPAIIHDRVAEATLLDIPNALVALQTWPGEVK
mgnify:CR=1